MTSASIIIAAFNEEKNITYAVITINAAVKKVFKNYELIVIDDGSWDNTGKIAEELAKKFKQVRVIHHRRNMGLGSTYATGIRASRKKYVMLLPGDNGILSDSIIRILKRAGERDIIMSYTENPEARSILRRIVSKFFTTTLNVLFNLHLRYYNGMVLYETNLVRQTKISTSSFAFQAEILIQLLKRGHTYMEVPMRIQENEGSTTKVFRIKNVIGVFTSIFTLVTRAYITKRHLFR